MQKKPYIVMLAIVIQSIFLMLCTVKKIYLIIHCIFFAILYVKTLFLQQLYRLKIEQCKYNLILVGFNKISKIFPCVQVNEFYGRQHGDMTDVYTFIHEAGIKGLLYNGDVDMAYNYLGDQWFVEKLNYNVSI